MAFASASMSSPQGLAQINITPLIDVMLVLLVIFMVAVPIASKPITLDLAQAGQPDTPVTPSERIELRIDAGGDVYLNGNPVEIVALEALLRERIAAAAAGQPPALQIDPSADADYGVVARVLAAANAAHVRQIGFVRR